MELALNEIKIQAKKLFKALKVDSALQNTLQPSLQKLALDNVEDLKLKHCLKLVAQQLGFVNWQEAQDILSGDTTPREVSNMGTYFYPAGCGAFINEWFSDYQQAKLVLAKQPSSKWLLPYKHQFVIVGADYINVFKLDQKLMHLWSEIEHDMVSSYGTPMWDQLSCAVIKTRQKAF